MEENLKRIEELKSFMNEDNDNIPVFLQAIEHMIYILKQCEKYSLPLPEIFPYAGSNGIQAEWEYDWYLEIDSDEKGISVLFVKGRDYDNAISCKLYNIEDAFQMVKLFIKNVVDINGNRW